MANTTVTNVSDLLLTNVTSGMEAGKQKVSEATGFSEIMDNAKDQTAKVQPIGTEDGAKASRTVVDNRGAKEIKAEEPVRKDPLSNTEDMEELTDEAAVEASEIIGKIKEVLNVSDEEITEAMETLGLTAIDLIDPVSVKDLCMTLTDTPDSISLLTNAEVYENVKEIIQTVENAGDKITAQFALTPEQTQTLFKDESFKDAVQNALSVLQNKSEADTLQPIEAPLTQDVNTEGSLPIQDTDVENKTDVNAPVTNELNTDKDVTVAADKAATVTVEVNREPDALKSEPVREVAIDDPQARMTTNTTESFKPVTKPEESNLKGNNEGFEHASRFAETETINVNAAQPTTVVNTEVNNLGDVIETVTTYSNEDANSIMSQVTESIRVNYSAETTSMELQLHPASLGTVNMQIASTNGIVTAHIIVQNEAVKAALESQLITLQQTFDEQGTKVEAVEVSVANYDLNKGTGSDTESNSQDRSAGRTGRVGRRRSINLADLNEEEIEELTEEEKISADMMARSGNSVDYTA
jgi:flagellar hook-length control protein FliK